jgi:hypothetical protein
VIPPARRRRGCARRRPFLVAPNHTRPPSEAKWVSLTSGPPRLSATARVSVAGACLPRHPPGVRARNPRFFPMTAACGRSRPFATRAPGARFGARPDPRYRFASSRAPVRRLGRRSTSGERASRQDPIFRVSPVQHLELRTSPSLTSASPRPPSQPRVREPVGYHSQVQPEHLQAVLPRVRQGHRLREGAPPSPCPQRTAPLFSRAYAPTAPAPSPPHGPRLFARGGRSRPPEPQPRRGSAIARHIS